MGMQQRGRVQVCGDGFFGVDLGRCKSFDISWSEKQSMQLRWEVFNVTSTQHFGPRDTRRSGFGIRLDPAVRNVGADAYTDVALRDGIDAGEVEGPRMRVSGPALGITGGHCDNNLLPSEFHFKGDGVANGPWAARAKVRQC